MASGAQQPERYDKGARKNISFSPHATLYPTVVSAFAGFWHIHHAQDHLFAARSNDGLKVVDVSDPKLPVEADSFFGAQPIRGSTTIGNILITVGRGTNGVIQTWDITTKTNVTLLDTYTPVATEKYSAIDVVDANHVCVAGQQSGFYLFNISALGIITLASSVATGSIENQGVCHYNDHAIFANYHYGIRILDTTVKANMGGTLDRAIAAPIYNGVTLRAWECIAFNDTLYVSTNVSSGSSNSPEKGLLALDISNMATIPTDGSTWIRCQIHAEDQDTWNGDGDEPYIGINGLEDRVYVGAGHGGFFVFDVSERLNPKYLGKFGAPESDSIYGVVAWTDSGDKYISFGCGPDTTDEGTHQLYIQEIHEGA